MRIPQAITRHNGRVPIAKGNSVLQVLVVEDNPAYAEEVIGYLHDKGHAVRGTSTAAGMWCQLAESAADILLLDLGLPDEDGTYLIHQLRMRHPEMGIVVVTARVRHESRIDSLILGADHYLTKPVKLAELNAVLITLGRRITKLDPNANKPGWSLNPVTRELACGQCAKLRLSERENLFLGLLARSPDGVSRNTILVALGEESSVDSRRRIDMLIYRLRQKVEKELGMDLPVQANYGGGYCLTAPFLVCSK